MMKRKVINSFFEVMNQCLIIRVTEDLDHHRVMSLREEADRLIEKERIQNIIFDFDVAPIIIDIQVNIFKNFSIFLGFSIKYFKEDSPL